MTSSPSLSSLSSSATLFRPHAHNGLWCCLLLPFALYASFESGGEGGGGGGTARDLKILTLIVSLFQAFTAVARARHIVYGQIDSRGGSVTKHLFSLVISDLFERDSSRKARLLHEEEKMKERQEALPAAPFVVHPPQSLPRSVVLALCVSLYMFVPRLAGDLSVQILAVLTLYSFAHGLQRLFSAYPNSFTFGEGCIVYQSLTLFAFETLVSLLYQTDDPATLFGSFSIVGKCGLLSCLCLCALPLVPGFGWVGTTPYFLASGFFVLTSATLPYLWWRLCRDPVTFVLHHIASDPRRSGLMLAWLLCLLAAVQTVRRQTSRAEQASTRVRKYFHALVVVVYTSGVLWDPAFLYLGTYVALSAFVLLESVRVYKVEPFSRVLNASFGIFLDEKDQGSLVLTHIYLLAGCSAPLWLAHDIHYASKTRLLSGVLAVGIGDSAASVCGSWFGRTKFPDSHKSLEGTAASILAQVLFLWLLQSWGLVVMHSWTQLVIKTLIVSLVEALTSQVDNLVLPILLYALL